MRAPAQTAAIITVGSELTDGLGLDTNSREIAATLSANEYAVIEMATMPDDRELLAESIRRLTSTYALVVVTGGLGPTHDDITREAASDALETPLIQDVHLTEQLKAISVRHSDPEAARQVFSQAFVLEGAEVLAASSGTAPGQIATTAAGRLVLLPGPPHEMREMLARVAPPAPDTTRILSCTGLSESDAQLIAQRELTGIRGIRLTVLATPGSVRVVLVGEGSTPETLAQASVVVKAALGDYCYATDGSSLAETVLKAARVRGLSLATAESCTGGLVSAALTSISGSSAVFAGGAVAYANSAKTDLLGVPKELLDRHGAVSGPVAEAMARGVRERLSADLAVSVTGIAGPDGGTPEKPIGLVWFAISGATGTQSVTRNLFGDRDGVRERATVTALDLIRRHLVGLEVK